MDPFRSLVLVLAMMSSRGVAFEDSVSEAECDEFDVETFDVVEGDALHFMPYLLRDPDFRAWATDGQFIWCKRNLTDECILSEEEERIHYHGGVLFIFNLSSEDCGHYICRHNLSSGKCHMYHLKVRVHPKSRPFLYEKIELSDSNAKVPCVDFVKHSCKDLNGNLSWYKDRTFLPGRYEKDLWVYNATKADDGNYTCMCTWKHNHHVYNSSASRKLQIKEPAATHPPQIISPTTEEQFADEGSRIILNCSVFCGRNVQHACDAEWLVSEKHVVGQTVISSTEKPSMMTISTAILTIDRVSTQHFQTKFKCLGKNLFSSAFTTLTLKARESIIPLVTRGVCVVLICVVAVVIVKCFPIDLTLLFRRCFTLSSRHDDGKVYDAYVIYQAHCADKASEETLCHFVTDVLPSVLEQKCGYRLFIHGRDDIPGEDLLELVEARMKLSRRLMVILNLGSGSGSEVPDQHHAFLQNAVERGYDWQMGMHQALFHRDMSVILIQLGEFGPQDYTHLPPSFQHLVRKRAPLRWPGGSRTATMWNSRFWKRVRYLMPATPAKKRPQSAVI